MNTQPEALRLADILQKWEYASDVKDMNDAAAELRRLHEVNQMLIDSLQWSLAGRRFDREKDRSGWEKHQIALAAIAKATN